jgi:hypothetical protein
VSKVSIWLDDHLKLNMKSLQNYLSFSFLVFFMEFRELCDGEWELIKPLLPPRARVGRPRVDDRVSLRLGD